MLTIGAHPVTVAPLVLIKCSHTCMLELTKSCNNHVQKKIYFCSLVSVLLFPHLQYVEPRNGTFLHVETGKVIGHHEGM